VQRKNIGTAVSHSALFVDDTYIYATKEHEHDVPCKLQRDLTAVKPWCEHWITNINERKEIRRCSSEDLESRNVQQLN
jgi:hypothetical protein